MSGFSNQALTVEERLSRNIVRIIAKDRYKSLAQILLIGDKEVVDDPRLTACTDGRNEKYGEQYCGSLTDPEFRYVILHENAHKMKMDIPLANDLAKIDRDVTNRALDHVINLILNQENKGDEKFAVMPKGGLADPRFTGMDHRQVFDILLKEKKSGGGGGGGGTEPSDDGSGTGEGTSPTGNDGGFRDDHDWEGGSSRSEEEQTDLEKEVKEGIHQGSMQAGLTGSGGNRLLDKLARPKVNWRLIMRDFVTEVMSGGDWKSFRRPNRRFQSQGYILPSSYTDKVGEIVNANDMSASISDREVSVMIGEQAKLCEMVKPTKVHCIYWDTEVCSHEEYGEDELSSFAESTRPQGGGGTYPPCIPAFMEDKQIKPKCAIVFTDGYIGHWGDWSCPVLWIILNNEGANPPFGRVVHITSEDM
jgi:predicted metal-dependent peptidase